MTFKRFALLLVISGLLFSCGKKNSNNTPSGEDKEPQNQEQEQHQTIDED